jgi:hypothetical protein
MVNINFDNFIFYRIIIVIFLKKVIYYYISHCLYEYYLKYHHILKIKTQIL